MPIQKSPLNVHIKNELALIHIKQNIYIEEKVYNARQCRFDMNLLMS